MFVQRLEVMRFESTFNPYRDRCEHADVPSAPLIRRQNLVAALEAGVRCGVHSLWVGRDLGHRGGRRTGLAFTDDQSLSCWREVLGPLQLDRATTGPTVREQSASTIWPTALGLKARIFLWNAFPFHPFKPGNPLSNRCHTRAEADACAFALHWLIKSLRPNLIVAIGLDSSKALKRAEIGHATVRHPSHGGQPEFRAGIQRLYGAGS